MAHAFHPSTWQEDLCEFEASFVYILSFAPARDETLSQKTKQLEIQKEGPKVWP